MELINRINTLNKEVKKLNKERDIALGKKETLTQQLNQGIADYNAKFQTNISADTVEVELNKVTSEVQAKVDKLEKAITQIKSGNYTEANATLEIKTPEFSEPMETGRVTSADAPIAPEVAAMVTPPADMPVTVYAESDTAVEKVKEYVEQSNTVSEPPVTPPVAPVMPTMQSEPEHPASVKGPAPDTASFLDMLNLAPGEAPVGQDMSSVAAPSTPAEPKVGLPPTNFTSFMGVLS